MKRKKKKQTEDNEKSLFHQDLSGFDIKVNTFGELESNFSIDKLNHFLNDQVEDKKLSGKRGPADEEE